MINKKGKRKGMGKGLDKNEKERKKRRRRNGRGWEQVNKQGDGIGEGGENE